MIVRRAGGDAATWSSDRARRRGRAGRTASPRSALVKPNSTRCARFFQARLAWVSMTPFGRPVVPDVYISRCTSSAATRGRAGASTRSVGQPRPSTAVRRRRRRRRRAPGRRARRVAAIRQLDECRVAHERPGLRMLEDVAHLGRGQPPVDRHRDGAEIVGGEEGLRGTAGSCTTAAPRRHPGGRRARAARPRKRPRLAASCPYVVVSPSKTASGLSRGAYRVVGEDSEPVQIRLHLGHARSHARMYRPVSLTPAGQYSPIECER